jgi:hypothetical protein
MSVAQDITGKQFFRWTVIEKRGVVNGKGHWLCRCSCGTEREVSYASLRRGGTKSCGCYRQEVRGDMSRRHGLSKTRTWKTWQAMHGRCSHPSVNGYERYGGRGIKVCERWKLFENFFEDMGERPAGASLDRIDVNGDYEPGNCRWSSRIEQARNRRDSIKFTWNGVTKHINQWAEETSLSIDTIAQRIKAGWPQEEILTVPWRGRRPSRG